MSKSIEQREMHVYGWLVEQGRLLSRGQMDAAEDTRPVCLGRAILEMEGIVGVAAGPTWRWGLCCECRRWSVGVD